MYNQALMVFDPDALICKEPAFQSNSTCSFPSQFIPLQDSGTETFKLRKKMDP